VFDYICAGFVGRKLYIVDVGLVESSFPGDGRDKLTDPRQIVEASSEGFPGHC